MATAVAEPVRQGRKNESITSFALAPGNALFDGAVTPNDDVLYFVNKTVELRR